MIDNGEALYVVVCAAGPAGDVGHPVTLAQDDGWTVQVIATPPALDFIDTVALEEQTGRPVRHRYRHPSEPRRPRADAIVVAPATYNAINKFAQGICDTYALGLLAEAPGRACSAHCAPPSPDAPLSRTPGRCRPPGRALIAKWNCGFVAS